MEPILRLLTPDDTRDAMALKEAAGWNQLEEDWRAFLRIMPRGCFALEKNGRVIATSTAIPYGDRFGWVGMVLVQPSQRRRGHGKRVLFEAVHHLEELGVTPALDATPAGRALYLQHGFSDIYRLERWSGEVVGPATPDSDGVRDCRTGSEDDWHRLIALDREAFGADRSALLEYLRSRTEAFLVSCDAENRLGGFLFTRPGSRFSYIGPVVARNARVAASLLRSALARFRGRRVGIDIPTRHGALIELVGSQGLKLERPLIRMAKGSWPDPMRQPGGNPEQIFSIAGGQWG